MQITALSTGMFDHLPNILATETDHPNVLDMLTGDTDSLWSSTLGYLTHAIMTADLCTLDKVKDHP